MDQDRLQQRLTAAFVAELEEHVGALNRDALALEQPLAAAERDEALRRLFRTAHTVKSAARAAGVPTIEAAAHQLEDLLAAARDEACPVDEALLGVIFEAADALEAVRAPLAEGRPLDGAPLSGLLSRLEALSRGAPLPPARRASKPATPAPAAPAPPATPSVVVGAAPCPICGAGHAAGGTCPPVDREAPRAPHTDAGMVRLPSAKLDALLDATGELHVAVGGLAQRVHELETLRERLAHHRAASSAGANGFDAAAEIERVASRLAAHQHDLERLMEPLLEAVRRARMLPFAEACQGFERLVRDLARQAGKQVQLRVEGGGVELDRAVLEELKDPLRHLVRNAVDHGVETPDERLRVGKPAVGTVGVEASVQGARVVITVSDDGRGIDRGAVRAEAVRRGLPEPVDDAAVSALLFRAGFSTARVVSEVSGRGVGLDVVRARVDAVQGEVVVASEPAVGARFTMQVPLTLSTLRAVLFRAGRGTFALPSSSIGGLARLAPEDILAVEGREAMAWRERHIPLVRLAACLGLPTDGPVDPSGLPVIVVTVSERSIAFVVDELQAEREVTIRPLGSRLRHLPALAGASLLPDGGVALILGAAALHRAALEVGPAAHAAAPSTDEGSRRPRVLLVEDSLTTRSLETMILEAAGYDVTPAIDGRDALDRIGALDVDVVVSDVQMPRLDGFTLVRALRALPRYAGLPIVLVTGMASDEDRRRGLEAGANAYLVKSAFDQAELLATIASLL
jgi:two-component system chemotaxis sensor kinase CheA